MTPTEAHPYALHLLADLGDVIGDRDGIADVLARHCDLAGDDWPRVALAALAWTFATYTRLDPDRQEEQ